MKVKVKELIEKLNKLDPELTVSTDGYEGGVTDDVNMSVVPVALNVNDEGYYGAHETNPGNYIASTYVVEYRVIIGRQDHNESKVR